MQETATPPAPRGPDERIADIPRRLAAETPERITYCRRIGAGWVDVPAAQFALEVQELARGFVAAGVQPGDRIGIMCRTRYEWSVLDFALATVGVVSIPVYESSSAEQVHWIASDSHMRGIVVETPAHAAIVEEVRADLPDLQHVWQVDGGDLDDLVEAGRSVPDSEVDARRLTTDRDTVATIIYTSGTTGRPKACELTHDNFLSLTESIHQFFREGVFAEGASMILFLPMAHVFARLIHIAAAAGGMRIGHSPDIKHLMQDLSSFRPTFLLVVPRVLEKIYNAADQHAAAEGRNRVFRLAARTAIAYSRSLDTGGPSIGLKMQHGVFERLVYSRLRSLMGGAVTWTVSGGAPLGSRLGHFFRGIGIDTYEGYGLTETTAPMTACGPGHTRLGTVGPPFPGTRIRIDDDGEVLVKGVGVFKGYVGDADGTDAFTPDGWFRTGDLGSLDEDGFLTITGRKKEIIVTAGGKNVSPAALEDVVRGHPLVSQCLVVGDLRPFVAALITLDADMVPGWGRTHGLPDLTVETALTDPVVHEHLQKAVDRANRHVSRAESIRQFRIVPGDFTEENGHLTPSLKLRREAIHRDYADVIEDLYATSRPPAEPESRG